MKQQTNLLLANLRRGGSCTSAWILQQLVACNAPRSTPPCHLHMSRSACRRRGCTRQQCQRKESCPQACKAMQHVANQTTDAECHVSDCDAQVCGASKRRAATQQRDPCNSTGGSGQCTCDTSSDAPQHSHLAADKPVRVHCSRVPAASGAARGECVRQKHARIKSRGRERPRL